MRLSRHAKNQARRLGVDLFEAEALIAHPAQFDHDEFGRLRYTGQIRGVRMRIVVALDEPDLIVTIHERRE